MKTFKSLLVVVAMATLLCSTVHAAQIQQIQPFSGIPNFSPSLTFNQFDTMGGTRTLQSIEVTLTLNVNGGQLILDNDGADPASGTFEFGGKATDSSTDVTLLDVLSLPVTGTASALHTGTFSLAGNPNPILGDYNGNPPIGMTYVGTLQTDTKSGFVGPAYWTSGTKGFIGTGTYDIQVDATQWSEYGSIGGIEYAVSPVSATGSLKVVYTYAVPEPATVSLLGLGLTALLRRRR